MINPKLLLPQDVAQMKIKLLTLLIVIAGVIMISGCVDSEKQPSTSKASDSLYRSIFYP
jgi:outer membrane murein-binding lipoprotein Lpp